MGWRRGAAAALGSLLLAACQSEYVPAEAPGEGAPSQVAIDQARALIREGFTQGPQHAWVVATDLGEYRNVTGLHITPRRMHIVLANGAEFDLKLEQIQVRFQDSMGPPCFLSFGGASTFAPVIGGSDCLERGRPVVDAFATLRRAALASQAPPSPQDEARFAQMASQYRSASPKPGPNEEIHKFEVQGQSAIRDKDFDSAEDYFAQGSVAAPWWPPFHFDRAMVLGELGDYDAAVVEMQRYLALVPDAANARAAQDKIYVWQRKAGQGGP